MHTTGWFRASSKGRACMHLVSTLEISLSGACAPHVMRSTKTSRLAMYHWYLVFDSFPRSDFGVVLCRRLPHPTRLLTISLPRQLPTGPAAAASRRLFLAFILFFQFQVLAAVPHSPLFYTSFSGSSHISFGGYVVFSRSIFFYVFLYF